MTFKKKSKKDFVMHHILRKDAQECEGAVIDAIGARLVCLMMTFK
jgi:hypothetical protein